MKTTKFEDGMGRGSSDRHHVNKMHAPIDREHDEPRDGYEPVPSVWILNALALAMGCGWYLGSHSGDFDAAALDGDHQVRFAAVSHDEPIQRDAAAAGRRVYNRCMACHQPDGRGLESQIPPLAGSDWVLGEPHILARILLHGMHQEVVVNGLHYNGIMPGWESLDDESVAGVLTYIRSAWDNDASAVDPDMVAQERRAHAGRQHPWTMMELRGRSP